MKYNDLQTSTVKKATRVGRGISAGKGKTAGRGTKGQNSRSGGGVRPGFEGGQNPLMQRLPKLRGFRSIRPKAEVVYTAQLNDLGANIDNQSLAEKGLISSPYVSVKVIAGGDITKKVSLKVQAISASAEKMLTKAGGSFTKVEVPKRQKVAKS